MLTRNIYYPLVSLFLLSICYAFFSYGLTAPNLVLSTWQPYWNFQTYMWETVFNNRVLLNQLFTLLITLFWLNYGWLVISAYKQRKQLAAWPIKKIFLAVTFVSFPLVLASNALSYDIFNYLFNAKMVVQYQANPHQSVALDFAQDPWVRFMHNTHTPAPYGHGWTILSLVPYILGFGKLIISWLNFRVFSWLSYLLLTSLYLWQLKKEWWKSLVVLLNPLLLIEVIGNSHNDLWMIVPAMLSLLLLSRSKSKLTIVSSLTLMAVSIFIKLATVVLLPILLVMLVGKWQKIKVDKLISGLAATHWPWLASLALFIPLLLERSKWFLPWYMSWSLVWMPLFSQPKNTYLKKLLRVWQAILIGFSIGSLYRYVPFLLAGNYDGQVVPNQIIITWLGGLLFSGTVFFIHSRFTDAR